MKRRDFIKVTGTIAAASMAGARQPTMATSRRSATAAPRNNVISFPRYRGFNLTEKTGGTGPREKFHEEDFEIMAEWGFDFARIPMSYWNWSSKDNWLVIDESGMTDVDEVVEYGKQYGIHVNLGFHRVPGYCINGRELEPMDLFQDTPERMQQALDATVHHWRYFARRYKGIPNSRLSFDLLNEPPKRTDENRYQTIVRALVQGIREEDPDRFIIADGKDIGRTPLFGVEDLGIGQSTRGYDPMSLSHYTATWVPKDEFETFNFPTWPLPGDDGKLWTKAALKAKLIDQWKPLAEQGTPIHVGEWGCFNRTPHDVTLRWMRDILSLWKDAGWGYAMWNLRGSFGVLNSGRDDVPYEEYKGHKLDRRMLELLKEF